MNVARFTTKHGTPDWHLERIHRVKKVAKELGKAVGVLLDLQGPEIRLCKRRG
jgi:pyruvate kinase